MVADSLSNIPDGRPPENTLFQNRLRRCPEDLSIGSRCATQSGKNEAKKPRLCVIAGSLLRPIRTFQSL